jgi:hypothetical protein
VFLSVDNDDDRLYNPTSSSPQQSLETKNSDLSSVTTEDCKRMSNDEESVELLPAVADGEQKTTRKKLELRLRPRSQIFSLKGPFIKAL